MHDYDDLSTRLLQLFNRLLNDICFTTIHYKIWEDHEDVQTGSAKKRKDHEDDDKSDDSFVTATGRKSKRLEE